MIMMIPETYLLNEGQIMEKRTIEKILSGEHSFVADKNPNASKEAIAILRYALYDICELSEDELSHILCKKLLIKLGLYKYYLAIESPLSSVEIKKAYVRNKICPNVFPYDEDELYRKVYISSLKDNKVKTVFCRFHNVRMCLIAMRCVLDMIFDTDDVTEYAYFADSHKEEMEDLFKLFKLDDFYESFCESPLDFVFLSLTMEEKKQCLTTYLELKEDEKSNNEGLKWILRSTEKQLRQSKYSQIR